MEKERKRFVIPQVTDQSTKKEDVIKITDSENKKPYIETSERFVSAIYGSKVKDVDYYPTADFNNGGKQYDFMREGKENEIDTKDYCVPKQEEFYGYSPIEEKNDDDMIKTYDSVSEQPQTVSPSIAQVVDNRVENVTPVSNYNQAPQNNYSQNQNYNQGFAQQNFYQNNMQSQNVYQNVNPQESNQVVREPINHNVRPTYQEPRVEERNPVYQNVNNYEQPQNNYQSFENVQKEIIQDDIQEVNEYEANNQYDEIANDFYSDDNQNEIDDLALDDYSSDEVVVEERWNPSPTKVRENKESTVKSKNDKYLDMAKEKKSKYNFPSINLLRRKNPNAQSNNEGVNRQREIIDMTLQEFDIGGRVVSYQKGPTVTLFEIELNPGVKYQKINTIKENLQGNLEAVAIRVYAPIPGKRTAGVEVPNVDREMVFFGDLVANPEFVNDKNPLKVILGMDVTGTAQYVNITEMPHALIAGCTRSGKSVCINTILMSIIYKAHPDDVKLILIDPKKVEFSKYTGLPHLATPVITDTKLAIATMRWLVDEMENRYDFFSSIGVTNYQEYVEMQKNSIDSKHMPYLVLVIDEFADLMTTGGSEVETIVARLTAKARAAGIHLIVATQRPSVDVISGTIKSNLPTRIAFKVQKALDSSIILDKTGAEKLLGNGDMLYYNEMGKECRIQGAFISTEELRNVVSSISTGNINFVFTPEELQQKAESENEDDIMNDPMFAPIARHIVETQNASINRIQTRFKCGFNRVQAIVEKLCELGVVSENLGSKARTVLMEPADLEDILSRR